MGSLALTPLLCLHESRKWNNVAIIAHEADTSLCLETRMRDSAPGSGDLDARHERCEASPVDADEARDPLSIGRCANVERLLKGSICEVTTDKIAQIPAQVSDHPDQTKRGNMVQMCSCCPDEVGIPRTINWCRAKGLCKANGPVEETQSLVDRSSDHLIVLGMRKPLHRHTS
jgi:hypothetical protein